MNVDVVHVDQGGTPKVVFDAKYKLASSTGDYANADHYQMLAYRTALQVQVAWLIYAEGGKDIRRKIKNAEVEVVAAPINFAPITGAGFGTRASDRPQRAQRTGGAHLRHRSDSAL